jgi:putative mRNA 3-end processing factor
MLPQDILLPTRSGVCCKLGEFHIDPTRPVDKAVITHGHSDHARPGHGAVLATQETLDIMRLRLGENFAGSVQAIRYGESINFGGVRVTLHPAGHVLGSAQIAVESNGLRMVASGDYKDVHDPTCAPFECLPCDVFITEATFGLPVFHHGDPAAEIAKLLHSVALFPDRAHLVGAYSLGKAQRLMALVRKAGYDEPIYLHGGMEKITRYYQSRGIDLGRIELVRGVDKSELAGAIILCPPSALKDLWSRRFPDPVTCFASGWMRVRARAPRRVAAGHLGSRRLGRSDRHHCRNGRRGNLGHPRAGGRPGALERDARAARPAAGHRWLRRRGRYRWRDGKRHLGRSVMNRFAELLDRLSYEPRRNNKLRLMTDYFASTPDPQRGWALAALTGALSFQHAKPGMIRALISERTDPVLFELSHDYVGDLSETVALMWPAPATASGKVTGTKLPQLRRARLRRTASVAHVPSKQLHRH